MTMQMEATSPTGCVQVQVIDLQPQLAADLTEPLIETFAECASTGRAVSLAAAVSSGLDVGWFTLIADDADASFVRSALPIVREFGVPISVFVSTSAVETGTWIGHERQPMTWDNLAELHETGLVSLGARGHGIDPWRSPSAALRTVEISAALFASHLGLDLEVLRCPDADEAVRDLLRQIVPIVI